MISYNQKIVTKSFALSNNKNNSKLGVGEREKKEIDCYSGV